MEKAAESAETDDGETTRFFLRFSFFLEMFMSSVCDPQAYKVLPDSHNLWV
jgi:hypothetical protein